MTIKIDESLLADLLLAVRLRARSSGLHTLVGQNCQKIETLVLEVMELARIERSASNGKAAGPDSGKWSGF